MPFGSKYMELTWGVPCRRKSITSKDDIFKRWDPYITNLQRWCFVLIFIFFYFDFLLLYCARFCVLCVCVFFFGLAWPSPFNEGLVIWNKFWVWKIFWNNCGKCIACVARQPCHVSQSLTSKVICETSCLFPLRGRVRPNIEDVHRSEILVS